MQSSAKSTEYYRGQADALREENARLWSELKATHEELGKAKAGKERLATESARLRCPQFHTTPFLKRRFQ